MNICLTPKAERELEEQFTLRRRAIEILDLVVAEWESDPASVQCFDLRIVAEATALVRRLKQIDPFWG